MLTNPTLKIWHCRMAHANEDALRYLEQHSMVTSLKIKLGGTLGPCEGCAKGKLTHAPFSSSPSRSKNLLDHLHMDLQGPFPPSITSYTYTLVVIDDNSRYRWKEYLKRKSETMNLIIDLIKCIETQTERNVKVIHTDGGG